MSRRTIRDARRAVHPPWGWFVATASSGAVAGLFFVEVTRPVDPCPPRPPGFAECSVGEPYVPVAYWAVCAAAGVVLVIGLWVLWVVWETDRLRGREVNASSADSADAGS